MIESFVTKTRDKAAALTFIKKTLKRHGSPEAITTDGLHSYGAATAVLSNGNICVAQRTFPGVANEMFGMGKVEKGAMEVNT